MTLALTASTPRDTVDAGLAIWRLNLLRGAYLLLIVGLGLTVWPGILLHSGSWELMEGVVQSMLGALSLLALIGLRHPLRMLPLLLFEIGWKSIWLATVALPKQLSGRMDEATLANTFACLLVVVFLPVIPWGYVARSLFGDRGARWR